jgi:hypothetical protein
MSSKKFLSFENDAMEYLAEDRCEAGCYQQIGGVWSDGGQSM